MCDLCVLFLFYGFFFKQKTAYEMRISDWSSDVCSSYLITIDFNLEGLLRADSSARADFYREMASIGAMTINEVRALENLPPVPGGDQPRMQMQNVPITSAGALEE